MEAKSASKLEDTPDDKLLLQTSCVRVDGKASRMSRAAPARFIEQEDEDNCRKTFNAGAAHPVGTDCEKEDATVATGIPITQRRSRRSRFQFRGPSRARRGRCGTIDARHGALVGGDWKRSAVERIGRRCRVSPLGSPVRPADARSRGVGRRGPGTSQYRKTQEMPTQPGTGLRFSRACSMARESFGAVGVRCVPIWCRDAQKWAPL
jgi:hypothetical protein